MIIHGAGRGGRRGVIAPEAGGRAFDEVLEQVRPARVAMGRDRITLVIK